MAIINVPKSKQLMKVRLHIMEPTSANHRTIPNNKPDIKIRDNKQAMGMLIDVAISGDRTVIKNEAEKI